MVKKGGSQAAPPSAGQPIESAGLTGSNASVFGTTLEKGESEQEKVEDKEAQMWYNERDASTNVPERSTQCLPDIIIPAKFAGVNR